MKITVIIPTFNESSGIAQVIEVVKNRSDANNIQEILVVDGSSTDDTIEKANNAGAQVLISTEKGRGLQLAYGAERAQGEILYFLHADSIPPEDFDKAILANLQQGAKAGCFQMRFDRSELIFRIYGWFTRFRSILCRGGDQSLFITRSLYTRIGGFNQQYRIFEDIDMIQRIRKVAEFKIIPQKIITSARKYEVNGFFRLQFLFALLHLKYHTGAQPNSLLRFYQKHVR